MHQGSIWWPAEQNICRQTKITSEDHLGWGIAGGLVNSCRQAVKRAISYPSPVDYWIPGDRGVQNGPIEPFYHAVRLRM
ncbi:hypothetical protein TNCV_1307551 [Trichonephila clavipes]|nr:hypothetical protein TNCV_1307551 [Trichonephila clavipes]